MQMRWEIRIWMSVFWHWSPNIRAWILLTSFNQSFISWVRNDSISQLKKCLIFWSLIMSLKLNWCSFISLIIWFYLNWFNCFLNWLSLVFGCCFDLWLFNFNSFSLISLSWLNCFNCFSLGFIRFDLNSWSWNFRLRKVNIIICILFVKASGVTYWADSSVSNCLYWGSNWWSNGGCVFDSLRNWNICCCNKIWCLVWNLGLIG